MKFSVLENPRHNMEADVSNTAFLSPRDGVGARRELDVEHQKRNRSRLDKPHWSSLLSCLIPVK